MHARGQGSGVRCAPTNQLSAHPSPASTGAEPPIDFRIAFAASVTAQTNGPPRTSTLRLGGTLARGVPVRPPPKAPASRPDPPSDRARRAARLAFGQGFGPNGRSFAHGRVSMGIELGAPAEPPHRCVENPAAHLEEARGSTARNRLGQRHRCRLLRHRATPTSVRGHRGCAPQQSALTGHIGSGGNHRQVGSPGRPTAGSVSVPLGRFGSCGLFTEYLRRSPTANTPLIQTWGTLTRNCGWRLRIR